MIQGQKYIDVMDQGRTVQPISADGTCRIYFNGEYAGNAKVPVNLFSNETDPARQGQHAYIGFVPLVPKAPDYFDDFEYDQEDGY